MDQHQFDSLTRALGAGASRRQVLKALAGGTIAAVIGLGGAGGGGVAHAASCRRWPTRECTRRASELYRDAVQKCAKMPADKPLERLFLLPACMFNARTLRRTLLEQCREQGSCDPGMRCCHGTCADFDSDPANCGGCGRSCGECEVCNGGTCEPVCAAGQTCCDGTCIVTLADPANCGECGRACGECEHCYEGQCESLCRSGETCCKGGCVPACAGSQVLNPDTCACECPVTCPDGQAPDPVTCECDEQTCPGFRDCPDGCCPEGEFCCHGQVCQSINEPCCNEDEYLCHGTCCRNGWECCDDGGCFPVCGPVGG